MSEDEAPEKKFKKNAKRDVIKSLYFIKKLSTQEIAKAMEMTNRGVMKMLGDIRKMMKQDAKHSVLAEERTKEFMYNLTLNYDERIKRLWAVYSTTTDENTKVNILKEIRGNEKQYLETMQSLGIMPNIRPAEELEGKSADRETLVIIAEGETPDGNRSIITEADNTAPTPDESVEVK